MGITNAELLVTNIPELRINIEGLKRHSAVCIFGFEIQPLDDREKKLRAWLLHTLVSAARHYSKMRELVQLQNNASHKDGGTVFYVFDIAEQLEDSVMAAHRFCAAFRMMKSFSAATRFISANQDSIVSLTAIRNQFEHMHTQIASGESGRGPISINLSDAGKTICFRKLRLETSKFYDLIEAAFYVVAEFYPEFDTNSAPEAQGPLKLTVTASFKTIEKER